MDLTEPHVARQAAEQFAQEKAWQAATAWALLAIAAELAEQRRVERKRRT